MTLHTEEQATFEGDGGQMIVGDAIYSLAWSGDDLDLCELVKVRLGSLELSRYQMIDFLDKATVERCEDVMAETLALKQRECVWGNAYDAAHDATGWAAE